jgi:hypothetical protein
MPPWAWVNAEQQRRPTAGLKKCLVIPITRHMKAIDRPLVRPLLIVLLATVAWTLWATDFGVNL